MTISDCCSVKELPPACASISSMRARTTFSVDFRMTYRRRSSKVSPMPSGAFKKSCSIFGIRARAQTPMELGSTGTSRQPRGSTPCSRAELSRASLQNERRSSFCGRKHIATAYRSASGSSIPHSDATFTMKRCGICTSTPAPSPVSGSQPQAPLCPKLRRTSRPCRMIWCDR